MATHFGGRKFQSLIGIQGDFERGHASSNREETTGFQSLIGIQGDFESGSLKPLLYLVFLVRFRQPTTLIAF